ncbi:hypothetical protein ACFSTA_03810 [Ornithinibacillus salinisoli]|uniref:DUF4179 domain-containing protein n=1 Tax=Ornithinibacillus salinisoli TaxID=1848459 RepID=A0ABW4VXS1_9BACI
MSKLSKKDFDEFLGKDNHYTRKDKDRFFNNMDHSKQVKKHWIPQLVTSALLICVLIIGVQLLQGDSSPLSTADHVKQAEYDFGEGVVTVDTWEEVEEYYLKTAPGLKRAEELGLTSKVDKLFTISDDSNLHIEKVWYNSNGMDIFYSISLPDPSTLTGYPTAPTISNIWVNRADDEAFPKQPMDNSTSDPLEGVIYNGRFYHHTSTNSILNNELERLNEIKHLVSTDLTVYMFNDFIKIPNVEIPIDYDKEKEKIISTTIDQEISNEYITLNFDQIDIGVHQNYIYGSLHTSDEYQLNSLSGSFSDQLENENVNFGGIASYPDPNSFTLSLPAFNTIPKEMDVNIDSIILTGNESFEFSLDVSDYIEKISDSKVRYEETPHEKIGEIKDTNIYLEQLTYASTGIVLTIQYEPHAEDQMMTLHARRPTVPAINDPDTDRPLLLSGVNENGDPAVFGPRGSDSGNRFNILLEKDFIYASKVVDIKIENLLYKVKVDETLHFPISDEK